jgi:hypothetical protein
VHAQDWGSVTATCLAVWVPLQALNFSVVPPGGRVIFVNVCNLVWNVIIDYLSHTESGSVDNVSSGAATPNVQLTR